MTLFEQRLQAALDRAIDENYFMNFKRRPYGIPVGTPKGTKTGSAAKPTPAALADIVQKYSSAPYHVDPQLIKRLAANPGDRAAFDAISYRHGRYTAIEVRNALKGQDTHYGDHHDYADGGYGRWGA